MANNGLRNNNVFLDSKMINGITTKVNLCNNFANLHFNLPLLSFLGRINADFSLIFSYFSYSSTENEIFGNRFNFNIFKRITRSHLVVILEDVDGRKFPFTLDSELGYYTSEKCDEKIYKDDDYYYIHTMDNLIYRCKEEAMVDKITFPNGDEIIIAGGYSSASDQVYLSIEENIGYEKILIYLDNEIKFANKIEHYIKLESDYEVVNTINFTYTENYLTKIEKYNYQNALTSSISITYTDSYIEISDDILLEKIRHNISNSKVIKVIKYNNNINVGEYVDIEYLDNITNVIDYKGRKNTYVFDTADNLLYTYNDELTYKLYKYENYKKIYESSTIYTSNDLYNLINPSLDGFDITGNVSTSSEVINSRLTESILLENGASITQIVNISSGIKKTYALTGFIKGNTEGSLVINMYLTDVNNETVIEEKEYTSTSWEPIILTKYYYGLIKEIKIEIISISGTFLISGLRLSHDYNEASYEYENGLMTKKRVGGFTYFSTYENNLLVASTKDWSGCENVYDDLGQLIYRINDRVEEEYAYENKQLKSKVIKTGLTISTHTYEYTNYNLTKVTNTVGHNTSCDIEYRDNKIKSISLPNGKIIYYNYNEQRDLTGIDDRIFILNDDKSIYRLYQYGLVFNYTYNNDNKLYEVSGDTAWERYEYVNESAIDEVHEDLLKTHTVGNLKREYVYDNLDNLVEIKENYASKYRYEYDDVNRIKKVYDNNTLVEEYNYYENGYEVTISNKEIKYQDNIRKRDNI